MARTPRILITGYPTAYHIMCGTTLDGFPLGDVEIDNLILPEYKSSMHNSTGAHGEMFAKMMGALTIVTSSSDEKLARASALGAD